MVYGFMQSATADGYLRKQWGFEGYVVSDDGSVADIFDSHRYTRTAVETSALAVKAGNDLDSGTTYAAMPGRRNLAAANLVQAVQQGLRPEKEINISVGRIMEAPVRMGEFDPPGYEGNPYNKITTNMYNTEENHTLALKAAQESMVLLKNANHTLPLNTTIGTIAVIGPNANAFNMQLGNYNGHPTAQHQISILDGIRQVIGADHVVTMSGLGVPLNTAVHRASWTRRRTWRKKRTQRWWWWGLTAPRKASSVIAPALNFPRVRML